MPSRLGADDSFVGCLDDRGQPAAICGQPVALGDVEDEAQVAGFAVEVDLLERIEDVDRRTEGIRKLQIEPADGARLPEDGPYLVAGRSRHDAKVDKAAADELLAGVADHGEVGFVCLEEAAVGLAGNGDAARVGFEDLGELFLSGSQRGGAGRDLGVQSLLAAPDPDEDEHDRQEKAAPKVRLGHHETKQEEPDCDCAGQRSG